jgi:hypothetical protein
MNILCATDLLPKSESAIDRAGILADQLGACGPFTLARGAADGISRNVGGGLAARQSTAEDTRATAPVAIRPPAECLCAGGEHEPYREPTKVRPREYARAHRRTG